LATSATALLEQGFALLEAGDSLRASEVFRVALCAAPELVSAHLGLGVALQKQRQPDAAVEAFTQVLALEPDHWGAHFNLGQLARIRGDLETAERHYRAALAMRPRHVPSLANLGLMLLRLERTVDAIALLERALAIDPALPDVRRRLGLALCSAGQLSRSLPYLEQAVAESGDDGYLVNGYALVLLAAGQPDAAIAALRGALLRTPDSPELHSNLLMLLHFSASYSADAIFAEHVRWAQQHVAHLPLEAPTTDTSDPERALRVGLVTPHVVTGPVPNVLLPLLEHRDPQRLNFIFYANSSRADAITARLRAAVDEWRPIETLDDDLFAAQVRADRIDIMIDLAGHSGGNRLLAFARRLAPRQLSWLDYFDTTGVPAIDYILTDDISSPEGTQRHFTERPFALPTRLCFLPPQEAPDVSPAPVLRNGYLTFGSFNRWAKTAEPVRALWARLLTAIPDARLLIKAREFEDDDIRTAALARFASHGIAAHRLELRPPSAYAEMLRQYADVDLALDTFPHNGGATTLDSLWMGVPVVTLLGKTMIGRQTAAMLHACGHSDLVAQAEDAFIAIGQRWHADIAGLSALRARLRDHVAASPLTDAPRFARTFETALRYIWRDYCASRTA